MSTVLITSSPKPDHYDGLILNLVEEPIHKRKWCCTGERKGVLKIGDSAFNFCLRVWKRKNVRTIKRKKKKKKEERTIRSNGRF